MPPIGSRPMVSLNTTGSVSTSRLCARVGLVLAECCMPVKVLNGCCMDRVPAVAVENVGDPFVLRPDENLVL
ncbi:hypothetical protein NDU88_004738 [Pleurodeles waltl]|uniref:Uncharacterized protein n=1 Tax=Pleurodeles waltl TaxID=8319 RepID=A0AAV7UJY4_PLEWA|nr:hypothetical protein NDU88_004738 [Pleurodeles waltl]